MLVSCRNNFRIPEKLYDNQGWSFSLFRRTFSVSAHQHIYCHTVHVTPRWGGRVVQWCWVNFQCRCVLLIWILVGQGPTALAVGAGGGCLDIFTLVYHFSPFSPSLWETARYRLKYCLKGPLNPKQPTNVTPRTRKR